MIKMSCIRYLISSAVSRSILLKSSIRHWPSKYKTLAAINFSSVSVSLSDEDVEKVSKQPPINNDNNCSTTKIKRDLSKGPNLSDFIFINNNDLPKTNNLNKPYRHPYLKDSYGSEQNVYFEVYGCQMNVSDTEVVWSILKSAGYTRTRNIDDADIVLIITCAIRESAEDKVWSRLGVFNNLKKERSFLNATRKPLRIGVLGCMAERLKDKILERTNYVDLIGGPDSYRDLPRLLSLVDNHETAVNVALSFEETYADVTPVRLHPDSVSAFVSIMRGCDNMCTYCIVPFVRGRERSRPVSSILDEIRQLSDQGIKEVTLLGQNVNSYRDMSETQVFAEDNKASTSLAKGFKTVYKSKLGGLRFDYLLDKVSLIDPEMRIRFTSPHPKDFPDEVLELINCRPNICKQIHLPAQSGNSKVLERMRRGYTRSAYLELVAHIRDIIPDIKLSSDFIAGFCGETDEEFEDTISLMEAVQYHNAFLFRYSMREKTTAHRRFQDDVPTAVKLQRLTRMTGVFRNQAERLNRMQVGTQQLVLVEGPSRKRKTILQGRTDGNTRVLIPDPGVSGNIETNISKPIKSGDYVVVQICESNSNSLTGIPLYHSTITDYHGNQALMETNGHKELYS